MSSRMGRTATGLPRAGSVARTFACVAAIACGCALAMEDASPEIPSRTVGAQAASDRHAHAGHADYGAVMPAAAAVIESEVVEASRVGLLVRLHRAAEDDLVATRPKSAQAVRDAPRAGRKGSAPARAATADGRRLKGT